MKVPRSLPACLLDGASHGIVDTPTLATAGLSRDQVQARERAGMLQRLSRGLFLIPNRADEWTPIAAAQRRWSTLVLTGQSALILHGCDRPECAPQERDLRTTEPGSRAPYPRLKRFSPTEVMEISGIRVLKPLSLLGRATPGLGDDLIEAAIETFLRRRIIGETDVKLVCEGLLDGMTKRERRRLGGVMDRRGWGLPPTESYLETLTVQRVLRPARLAHTRQVVISLGGAYLKRFDFQLESGLLLECHGMAFHTSKAAVQQDAAYGLRLRLAGLDVETITWDDVTRRPRKTGRDLSARSAQVAGARAPVLPRAGPIAPQN